ncbi:MAG: glycosyltransferase [Actinobacteria bacterium]|nr:glycosyltransferase [Actinomycetota bacterium]
MQTSSTRTRPEPAALGSAEPTVLAIVVTHRGREWLRDCLVALAGQTYRNMDVLVIDDASPDFRERPHLKRLVKRHVRRRRWGLVRTRRPLGFGGAINYMMGRIRTDAEFLLFLHDDAALERTSVEKMVACMAAKGSTAIVGPKIVAWDDPDVLEEIGMATDRLGYPYKALEEGEIDGGQHDGLSDVFYVTSTCMLVRHDVFRRLGGWDDSMRAFSEDLDLCWRARLAGYSVRLEPQAKARHAIALARNLRESPFVPQRYFIRRNRLRAVAKNASALRLIGLIPAYIALTFIEMLAFLLLRQFGEIGNLARALVWNFVRFPQVLAERARVQRQRRVSDRDLKHLTVRQTTRARSYFSQQAERIEEAWGKRADLASRTVGESIIVAQRLRGWPGVVAAIALIGLFLGFRHFLWSPPAVLGELLPYPDRATAMWRAFFSPWQGVGLGEPGPTSPGFLFLGVFPILTFGAVGAAQKLLVLSLGAIGFAGAYRLVGDLVDRPARIAAGLAYAFGSVGYAGLRAGQLGALVFGAAAPFVLLTMLRLSGWVRPPMWNRGKAVARLAIGTAVSASFVPGSLAFYLIAAIVLTGTRAFLDRTSKSARGLISCVIGLIGGAVLLLPWSVTWWSDGGVFDVLRGDRTWQRYAAGFEGHGAGTVVLGQTPEAPVFLGLALVLLGFLAVGIGEGQRRRVALALWGVIAVTGLLISGTAAGWVKPWVAGPTEAGVLASVAFAGLTGLAVGAFRLDLPRRGLGIVHGLGVGAIAVAGGLVAISVAPALLSGAWRPGPETEAGENAQVVSQLDSLFEVAAADGQFRILWVGNRWGPQELTGGRAVGDYFVTGARGQVLSDLFERTRDRADLRFETIVASARDGSTDRVGHLLAPYNVRFVVLERGPGTFRWLVQRDLGIIRVEPDYLLLENSDVLARSAVYSAIPEAVRGPANIAVDDVQVLAAVDQETPSRYRAGRVSGSGAVFLSEARDRDWEASLGGEPLERVPAGWGNGFRLDGPARGELVVAHPRSLWNRMGLLFLLVSWIVVGGAASSRRRSALGRRILDLPVD